MYIYFHFTLNYKIEVVVVYPVFLQFFPVALF